MTDFIRELEDDIQQEKIALLWKKYGNYVIGIALAIVLGTAGYSIWTYLEREARLTHHVSLSEAVKLMKQGKKEEALQAFQTLAKDGGGYGKLAQLYEASLTNSPETLYTEIAKENVTDPALSTLPKILDAARNVNDPKLLEKISPLTTPGNAWAPLALELMALADLKKGDQVAAAQKYIRILEEPSATGDEQIRAQMMLSQLHVPASLVVEDEKKEEKE